MASESAAALALSAVKTARAGDVTTSNSTRGDEACSSEGLGPGRKALLAIVVSCLACLPFLASTGFGFVAWDDDVGLENNLLWRGLGTEQLRWMFTTFTLGHWQPLAWLSFGMEHALWGLDPRRMHGLNVALHGLNAALLFLVAFRVLPEPARPRAALIAALLFALHPLRVESVAWITERAHLLATAFALACVLAWLRGAHATHSRRWRLLAIVLFALSLMSKAWGISLPLVLVILDWPSAAQRAPGSLAKQALRQVHDKAAFFLLALAAVSIELLAKQAQVELASFAQHGIASRASQVGLVVYEFLAKTLWPVGLSPLYEFRPGIEPLGLLALLVACAASVALFRGGGRMSAAFRAWLAGLVLLAPVSGIAQAGLQQFADRYTYLAAMPLALLAGVGIARALERAALRSARWAGWACVLALLATLAVASTRQVEVWRDSTGLWRRVVEVDPRSFIGWHNLGTTLHRAGQTDQAMEAERRSLELEPGIRNRDAWFHLGQLELLYGDRARARQAWRAALELDPADLRYLDWLASTQPSDEARRALWDFALEAAPDNAALADRRNRSP